MPEVFKGRINRNVHQELTTEHIEFYHREGFLIVENAVNQTEIQQLKDEAVAISRGQRGAFEGILPGSEALSDEEVIRQYLCIHFPHKISETVYQYLTHPVIRDVLTDVIGPNVKCMQSMLFVKSSGKPGQAWHQDEKYIPTRDRSLAGAWIAVDDATIENGCLWVIPRSHESGVLFRSEFTENPDFDCSPEAQFPYEDSQAIPVEVKAGSIVFFNGHLLHRSLPNRTSSGYRRVLVNHYMNANSKLPWSNGRDFRDIVMIAGEDPYAYKGITDISKAHLRSTGKGGCADGSKKSLTGA